MTAPADNRRNEPASASSAPALALIAAALCVGGLFFWRAGRAQRREALVTGERYLEALRANDAQAAYALLSDSARRYCTLEEFAAAQDRASWTWSGLRVERLDAEAALLAYELRREGRPRVEGMVLVRDAGRWAAPYNNALVGKAAAALERKEPDRAAVFASLAANVNPRDPLARAYLCEAAHAREMADEARAQCAAALELSALYPPALTATALRRLRLILAASRGSHV